MVVLGTGGSVRLTSAMLTMCVMSIPVVM